MKCAQFYYQIEYPLHHFLHSNITHFSMKGEMILKSAMKCQKNKFYVQIQAQEMIIYHRHKNKNTEFIPEKNWWWKWKREINGKIESFIDIDSFLLYISYSILTLYSNNNNRMMSIRQWIYFLFLRLVLLLVKEICFPHSIHISSSTKTARYCPSSSLWFRSFFSIVFFLVETSYKGIFHVMSMAEQNLSSILHYT